MYQCIVDNVVGGVKQLSNARLITRFLWRHYIDSQLNVYLLFLRITWPLSFCCCSLYNHNPRCIRVQLIAASRLEYEPRPQRAFTHPRIWFLVACLSVLVAIDDPCWNQVNNVSSAVQSTMLQNQHFFIRGRLHWSFWSSVLIFINKGRKQVELLRRTLQMRTHLESLIWVFGP